MARVIITIDIPDDRQPELLAMLRDKYGPVGSPPRDRTPQELIAGIKGEIIQSLKADYRAYIQKQRDNADLPLT